MCIAAFTKMTDSYCLIDTRIPGNIHLGHFAAFGAYQYRKVIIVDENLCFCHSDPVLPINLSRTGSFFQSISVVIHRSLLSETAKIIILACSSLPSA